MIRVMKSRGPGVQPVYPPRSHEGGVATRRERERKSERIRRGGMEGKVRWWWCRLWWATWEERRREWRWDRELSRPVSEWVREWIVSPAKWVTENRARLSQSPRDRQAEWSDVVCLRFYETTRTRLTDNIPLNNIKEQWQYIAKLCLSRVYNLRTNFLINVFVPPPAPIISEQNHQR